MTFNSREVSTQDGQPVELYKMFLSGRTYYMTSAEEDVQFGGYSWQATPGLSRTPITLKKIGEVRTLDVTIGRQHQAAAILMSNGIPPRTATLQIKRVHRGDAEARIIWDGLITTVELQDSELHITVADSTDIALQANVPFAVISGTCQHMLYGFACGVSRDYPVYETTGFLVATQVIAKSGNTITVAIPHVITWAKYGEVRRLVDGERRSVLEHVGTSTVGIHVLTLDVPFAYLNVGDDLEVWAGCSHDVETCKTKFANAVNFGGHPDAPLSNPINNQDE